MNFREATMRISFCLALAFVSTFTIANAANVDAQTTKARSIPIAPVKIIPDPGTIKNVADSNYFDHVKYTIYSGKG